MKKKLVVSACLLGEYCRYDGKTKQDSSVLEAIQGYEVIPFCPEAPLFGTPRERISVVEIAGEDRILMDESGLDVSDALGQEIAAFIENNPKVDAIILKSKSPSCGIGTTPVSDSNKNFLHYGNGLAAKMFLEHYTDIAIVDEKSLANI